MQPQKVNDYSLIYFLINFKIFDRLTNEIIN